MATASKPSKRDPESFYGEDQFPLWKKLFTKSQRRAMLEEDLLVSRTVGAVLVALVAMGMITMVLTVLFLA